MDVSIAWVIISSIISFALGVIVQSWLLRGVQKEVDDKYAQIWFLQQRCKHNINHKKIKK